MPTKIMRIIKCFVMSTGDGGMSSARAVIILLLWRVQHKNVQYEESQSLSTTTEIYSTKLGLVEIFFDPKDVSRCNFVFCNKKKRCFPAWLLKNGVYYHSIIIIMMKFVFNFGNIPSGKCNNNKKCDRPIIRCTDGNFSSSSIIMPTLTWYITYYNQNYRQIESIWLLQINIQMFSCYSFSFCAK